MNDNIINLLNELQTYSYYIKQLNLKQAAGDYDYIVAWFKSSEFTKDGSHLPPNPAGENTIDPYSNNCPIPYTRSYNLSDCYDTDKAVTYLTRIYEILNTLSNEVSDEVETVAVNSYIEYTYTIIEDLGGEVDPPEPPVPPEPDNRIVYSGLIGDDISYSWYGELNNSITINNIQYSSVECLDGEFNKLIQPMLYNNIRSYDITLHSNDITEASGSTSVGDFVVKDIQLSNDIYEAGGILKSYDISLGGVLSKYSDNKQYLENLPFGVITADNLA